MSNRQFELPPSAWFDAVRTAAVDWYSAHGRDLPWRGTTDPYAVWVSEIMLQQTTVATVRPAYARFLETFPTIERLAQADEHEVLRLWEGLGYYRRARQLHAAAQRIMAEHDGVFPNTPEQIANLPGIGRYTLGAIGAFAFDLQLPILEANTLRLWARLLGETRLLTDKAALARLWHAATAVLPSGPGSGTLNQSLMDLGSQVCLPRAPLCLLCPLRARCRSFQEGAVERIPTPPPAKVWTPRHEAAVLLRRANKVLLVSYPRGVRWAGLWDLPRITISENNIAEEPPRDKLLPRGKSQTAGLSQSYLGRQFGELLGMPPIDFRPFQRLRHVVTRYKITLDLLTAELSGRSTPQNFDRSRIDLVRWVTAEELQTLPLPTTGRKMLSFALKNG